MKLKKTFAAILALTMTVAALPTVSAEKVLAVDNVLTSRAEVTNGEVAPASDFEYEVNGDGESVTITGYKGNGGDVVIPSEIEGKKVTSIGNNAFDNCTSLASVTIPDGVTSIGDSAFRHCTSLTSVTIPDSVTSIGGWAFGGCTSLTSVEIPNSVTSIGLYAFYRCTSLTSVEIPDSVTSIGAWAFSDCTSLTAINVGEKNVNYSSQDGVLFNKDKTVLIQYPAGKTDESYDIPDSVTSIGDSAFSNCTSLTSVTIPDSVTSIGGGAFSGCSSLTSVTIPNSVTSIGESAFWYCTSLTSVTIPNSVTSIGYSAFEDCTSLSSVTIPDSVTSIGSLAFSGCTSLTSVTIPDSVTSIGGAAFNDCTSLTSVTIPDSVTEIGAPMFSAAVFRRCTSLTAINVDEKNVNYSSENGVLFNKDKTALIQYPAGKPDESYEIPAGVTNIVDWAFDGCTSLTSVTVPDSATSIDTWAFKYRGHTSLSAIIVDKNNENYSSENGVLFNKDRTVLIQYPVGKTDKSYDIPDSVTSIDYEAFYGCAFLTSVTISGSVTSIGYFAFEGCTSLTSVTIPDSVTSIGDGAFSYCTSLTIYGYENSFAQRCAAYNKIPFKIIGKEAEINKDTGIIIENPNLSGKTLEVKTTATTDTEITYNITLKDKDGKEVQPTGNVTVKIPLPEGWTNATVSRKEANSDYTDMNAVCENGYMVFTTDHFSEYVLKQKPAVTLGDLNDDEKININDVKIALRGALNNSTLTEDQKIAADVNEDEKVNISDVKIILKAALNGGTIGG